MDIMLSGLFWGPGRFMRDIVEAWDSDMV